MNLIDRDTADNVERRLSDKNDQEKLKLWMQLKDRFNTGDSLRGVIYYKAHYGVWLDVDLEFPALLRIPDMIDLDYQKYLGNDCYVLGEEVTLSYIGMNEVPDKILVSERFLNI